MRAAQHTPASSPFAWKSQPLAADWSDVMRTTQHTERQSAVVDKRRERGEKGGFMEKKVPFQPPHYRKPKAACPPQGESKTGKLREMLRINGPLTRAELGAMAGLSGEHVAGLLQKDIKARRVRRDYTTSPLRFVLVGAVA